MLAQNLRECDDSSLVIKSPLLVILKQKYISKNNL